MSHFKIEDRIVYTTDELKILNYFATLKYVKNFENIEKRALFCFLHKMQIKYQHQNKIIFCSARFGKNIFNLLN